MLTFLYETSFGRFVLKIITQPFFSAVGGTFLKTPPSRMLINRYIRRNEIDMSRFAEKRYRSFNDFFIRELKKGEGCKEHPAHLLLSPCDGKASAYTLTIESSFRIKNTMYSIKDLLEDEALAKDYNGGACMIFRLTPDDYHRYSYIDDGEILGRKKIRGVLNTVRPIAHSRYRVFIRNTRVCTLMRTVRFGDVVQIEVGALMVGKIRNYKDAGRFSRGEEKGFFEFGGSTILLLFKEEAVHIRRDIFETTACGGETVLHAGDIIGSQRKEKTEGAMGLCE